MSVWSVLVFCSKLSSRLIITARGSGLRLFRKMLSIGLPFSPTAAKYSNRNMDWSTTSSTSADCTPVCSYGLQNGFASLRTAVVWVYKLLVPFLLQTGWQLSDSIVPDLIHTRNAKLLGFSQFRVSRDFVRIVQSGCSSSATHGVEATKWRLHECLVWYYQYGLAAISL